MKNQKSILSLAIIASLSLFFFACNENKNTDHSTATTSENQDNPPDSLTGEPTKTDLIDEYLKIKTALTNNNTDGANKAAYQLALIAQTIKFEALTQEQRKEVTPILEFIQAHSEHIAKSEIEHQIEHFEGMGKDFQDLLAIVGSDRKLYQQYCPMYKSEGGMWLSQDEQISNPLFKGKMGACGSVKDVIEAG